MAGFKSDMVAFTIGLLLLGLTFTAEAVLKCYRCTDNGPESDCEIAITEVKPTESIISCKPHQKYCTIRRVEKTRFPGKVSSFSRSCESDPAVKNDVDVGVEDTTFFVSCQTDLCNSGDGTFVKMTDGPSQGKPELPGWAYFLGIGSGSNITASLTTLIAAMLLLALRQFTMS